MLPACRTLPHDAGHPQHGGLQGILLFHFGDRHMEFILNLRNDTFHYHTFFLQRGHPGRIQTDCNSADNQRFHPLAPIFNDSIFSDRYSLYKPMSKTKQIEKITIRRNLAVQSCRWRNQSDKRKNIVKMFFHCDPGNANRRINHKQRLTGIGSDPGAIIRSMHNAGKNAVRIGYQHIARFCFLRLAIDQNITFFPGRDLKR